MDEKEVKDTTNPEENVVQEENEADDGLVEVVNEEVEESDDNNENIPAPVDAYPSSASKLTWVIYLIIFISILIWVYFYVTQNNNEILNKILGKENSETWQIETLTWETSTSTVSDIESDNISTGNIDNTDLIDNKDSNENDSSVSSSSTGTVSWTWGKSEEVIIKDFEKELDSLFNVIDENAK